MKKYMIRFVGALCILAAVAVMFLTSWVQIKDVKRQDLRQLRTQLTEDLAVSEETMLSYREFYKEDLKEYGLPTTSGRVKSYYRKTESLIKELVDTEVSFNEVLWIAKEMPGYITDTEALLEIPELAEKLIRTDESAEYIIDVESMEETVEAVAPFKAIFIVVVGLFVTVIALACLAAITHMLNKGRWVKYIFLVLLAAAVVGICVGVPVVSETVLSEVYLMSALENMSLRVTIMPYLSLALAFVPVVLDIIFERKPKKAAAEM